MIDIAASLIDIESFIPAAVDAAVSTLPAVDTALALAEQVGADPGMLVDVHSFLSRDHEQLEAVLAVSLPLMTQATADVVVIAAEFLVDALRILPRALTPVPAVQIPAIAQLAWLAVSSIAQAALRIEQLRMDLMPEIAKLNQLGTQPKPPLPAEVAVSTEEPSYQSAAHTPTTSSTSSSAQGQAAVQAAKSQLGTPYVWGGTTPGAGFDCSGLTQWAWRQAGVELPRLAEEQTIGRPVAHHELQAGDLVVWDGHVAMYDGEGSIVEAGDPVSVSPLRQTNMGMPFKGYFRPTG